MNEDQLRQQLNNEVDALSINYLTDLGNRAVALGIIAGHGYRGGRYELLYQGKAMMFSPQEAQTFLEKLLQDAGS